MKLEEFLKATPKVGASCICCSDDMLASEVYAWIVALAAGKTRVTASYFHANYVLPNYGNPRSPDSIRDHVRKCLGRDPKTGRKLK
jgi:hypothetical protein